MATTAPRGARAALALAALAVLLLQAEAGPPATKVCRRETPLPADVSVTAPAPAVAEGLQRFSGIWVGAWNDFSGVETLCHTLVVEEVLPNGYARVVYSHGTASAYDLFLPSFWRVTGQIVDGVLRFRLPTPLRPELAYRFDGAALTGTYPGLGSVRLEPVADRAEVTCAMASRDTAPPRAAGPRARLTIDELLTVADRPAGPVHNDHFLPVGAAAPPRHAFRGALTVAPLIAPSAHQGCAGLDMPLPGFTVAFFSHREHLVPVVRDLVRPPGALIVSPGRVWSEPGDRGMSRASFPLVITSEVTNEAHNGLATFLYDDTRVSGLRFQFVQETAAWARFDSWGHASMTYAPAPVADEAARRAEFDEELRLATPIRPWSALPASAARALDAFDGDARPEDISANGLVVDGTLYVRGCHTRYGPYPYCRHMRHGVFSVTKSMGAAVALLRLAQRYGDGVLDERITDHVALPAGHDGWAKVTFADALNMATGIGNEAPQRQPLVVSPDENRPKMFDWLLARTARAKLDGAAAYGKYAWGPGEVLRYNSTHTFVLAAAMDPFLKKRAGPTADLWDMVVEEVYRPIGILHAPVMRTLETDGGRGVPILGYGLYPTVDDVAKVVTLLQSGGQHQGRQLLSPTLLAQALFRTPATGLSTGLDNRFGDVRYQLSFWAIPYRAAGGCLRHVPYMAGYGGNLVALLPNGITVFRFADGFDYDLESMILAGEALRPLCPSGSPAPTPPARPAPLGAAEVRAALSGRTFQSGPLRIVVAADGRLYGSSSEGVDVGTWSVAPDGAYCRTWNASDTGRTRCYALRGDANGLELTLGDRWARMILRPLP